MSERISTCIERSADARIAILFHRLGPYHHARLLKAAQVASIVAVEFSEVDHTYAWDKVERSSRFQHVTLFSDRDFDKVSIISVWRRMAQVLGEIRPDVVAVPGWSGRGALFALAWSKMMRVPAIVMSASTARDEVRTAWKEMVKRQVLRLCSTALAGGQAQLDYLVELGVPQDRIFLGYDVVDNHHFAVGADAARRMGAGLRKQLGLPPRFFLASGRFVPKKNLKRLLEAFAEYKRRAGTDAFGLVLLGDGPERNEITRFLAEMQIADHVLLPGFKQYGELPTYYGFAEGFVHASTSEQWGLVVNEAMAAALPVLVSRNCGCARDLVEEGRNGFTFDPENIGELADLMCRLSSDECNRATMGEASREIIGRWSPETFSQGLLQAASIALDRPTNSTMGSRQRRLVAWSRQ